MQSSMAVRVCSSVGDVPKAVTGHASAASKSTIHRPGMRVCSYLMEDVLSVPRSLLWSGAISAPGSE